MIRTEPSLPSWLRVFLIATIILGVFFRFVHLDRKVFWFDEVINSLHSAGYSKDGLTRKAQQFSGQYITVKQLQVYQYASKEKNSFDVIRVLAKGEPQSPPLYYILAHWWEKKFGHSVAIKRSLSAGLSLLVFPITYWLCLELFESKLAGWIATSLISVSPFHVLFAQEFRVYILWIVMILLSSLAFLRAVRIDTFKNWTIYSIISIFAFYTFPFSIMTIFAHGIYLTAIDFDKRNERIIAYLKSSLFSLLFFSPWIFFILKIDPDKMGNWREQEVNLLTLLKTWVVNPVQIFFDVDREYRGIGDIFSGLKFIDNSFSIFITLSLWLLILYSLFFAIARTSKNTYLFILIVFFIPLLTLIMPDLLFGGIRSAVSRYLIPSYLGIHLSVAYAIAHNINKLYVNRITRQIWIFILLSIIGIGAISNVIISREQSWWNKGQNYNNIPIARIINRSKSPVIVSWAGYEDLEKSGRYNLVSISYLLKSDTKILFLEAKKIDRSIVKLQEAIDEKHSVFIFNPNKEWEKMLTKKYGARLDRVYAYEGFNLWKIE